MMPTGAAVAREHGGGDNGTSRDSPGLRTGRARTSPSAASASGRGGGGILRSSAARPSRAVSCPSFSSSGDNEDKGYAADRTSARQGG